MQAEKAAVPRKLGFFGGLGYPLRGARFVYREHPELARFWLPPIALTALALLCVFWFGAAEHAAIAAAIWRAPEAEGLLAFLHRVFEWLVLFAIAGVGLFVVALCTSVIAAPFNDALSERVESLCTGRAAAAFSAGRVARGVARAIGLELAKLALYCAVMGPMFLVSLAVPGAGALAYSALGMAFTSFFFAIDYVDWAASRRELSVAERLRFAQKHLFAMLGLGAGITVLLFVPLVNLLFMPAAVAGATLMFVDLTDA